MRRSLTVPAAILMVVVLIGACTSGDDTADEPAVATTVASVATVAAPAATTEGSTMTESVPAVVPLETAIATVEALQDAYNAYDAVAAAAFFPERGYDDVYGYAGTPMWQESLAVAELVGLWGTVSDCEPAGETATLACFRSWEETHLSGKAGVVQTCEEIYYVDGEGLISNRTCDVEVSGRDALAAFEAAFADWMATAHPDAYDTFYVAEFGSRNAEAWYTPEGVAELSRLIDEFVAQSDEYPLSP